MRSSNRFYNNNYKHPPAPFPRNLQILGSFHKRYEPALVILNMDTNFNKVLNANDDDKPLLRSKLRQHFDHLFSSSLKTDSKVVSVWIDEQFQGLSFQDLIEKYMAQNFVFSDSLQIVSKNASKDNALATEKMANQAPTKVTAQYKNNMMKHSLFRPAFTSGILLRYEVAK